MTIRFLCPNGHGLSSSAEKSGGYGRCPTCDILFQVPFAETEGKEIRRAEAVISFACPVGHVIRVPGRMAGQLGKCPTCERTVRAPAGQGLNPNTSSQTSPSQPAAELVSKLDESQAAAKHDEPVSKGIMIDPKANDAGVPNSGQQSQGLHPQATTKERRQTVGHYPHPPAMESAAEHSPLPPPPPSGANLDGQSPESPDSPHPMTALFEALWDGTQRDAIVDIYYGDNQRISPQHYAHELSRGQHAIFAVLEQNETQTLYLIPWSRIHRVAVREITELPPGMFD
ncbi:MAG: hypothetical protein MPJ50_06255 [Pirellulales bacterium]|nr:hypothetical protein [Pirellulales bacterium]